VYLPTIKGHVPCDVILAFRAFLEFYYIVQHDVITETTLQELQDALDRYHHSVLFDAPQIPAGIQSFQWIPVEWDWNLEKLKKIHRNETESSGMEPESTGMTRFRRNDWRKKLFIYL